MTQLRARVGSSVGLHARPAMLVAQEAAKAPISIKISKGDGDPVDARSVLSILALDARQGEEVTLYGEGEDAESAISALAAFIESDLDAK
ncbi:HPr family phosphocarrier protein [Acidithrix sp. C25]|uniref:HPr family phosphocarrier protein n=1 Tax=Acidithrix sp. C25 TaxID=1671482 RepID=UPI00191BB659|nr:HPr family phosphocarrier protein [Acidithrix sp. C25]